MLSKKNVQSEKSRRQRPEPKKPTFKGKGKKRSLCRKQRDKMKENPERLMLQNWREENIFRRRGLSLIYILFMAIFVLQWYYGVVATEIIWPTKPKYLLSGPLEKKFAKLCCIDRKGEMRVGWGNIWVTVMSPLSEGSGNNTL